MSHETQTPATLPARMQRKGMRRACAGQSVGVVFSQLIANGGVGALLVKHLGGSNTLAMLLGSMFGLAAGFQLVAALLVHPERGKRFLLRCWALSACVTLLAGFVPFVLGQSVSSARVLVGLLMLAIVLRQLGSTFWFPLLHDVVPEGRRGRFFGTLRAWWSSTLFVAALLTGWWLGDAPETWRFQVVIFAGAGLILLRNLFVAGIPQATHPPDKHEGFGNWRRHIKHFLGRKEVVGFCVYMIGLGFCAGFLRQPLVLMMKQLGLGTRDNVVLFAFPILGMVLSLLVGGRLVDAIGTRKVYFMAHLALCAVSIAVVGVTLLPLDTARWLLAGLLVLAGGVVAVIGLATTAQFFHFAPLRGRAFFLSVAQIMILTGPATSALAAGGISDALGADWRLHLFGLRLNVFQVMLSISAGALLVLLLALGWVEDVHPSRDLERSAAAP
jgi:MFS family permease